MSAAVRGRNPLAGLSAEALRPIQNQDQALVGDAELLALCDRFVAIETAFAADATPDDDEETWEEISMSVGEQQTALLGQILSLLPARTLEGAQALARVYAVWTLENCTDYGPEAPFEDRLLGALLRGLWHDHSLDHRARGTG